MSKSKNPKSNLGKAVHTTVTKHLLETLPGALAEKFELDKDQVNEFLMGFFAVTKPVKGPSKPNAYVNYSSSNRKTIQAEMLDNGALEGLSKKEIFGAVGKEVGSRWKALSKDEQVEWKVSGAAPAPTDAPPAVPEAEAEDAEAETPPPKAQKSKSLKKKVVKVKKTPVAAPAAPKKAPTPPPAEEPRKKRRVKKAANSDNEDSQ